MKVIVAHLDTLRKIAEALPATSGGARVAAMLAKGHKVISIGVNQDKTHPFAAKYRKNSEAVSIHAEIHAIQNALHSISARKLRRMTLYVVRVKRPTAQSDDFVYGLAKPCDGCMKAIVQYDIREVVYSTDVDGKYAIL